ncbi:hypothetical protein KJ656_16825 [bacterium]|nr:hypothetical protein [bacterium]
MKTKALLFLVLSILIQPIFSQELKEMEIKPVPESESITFVNRNLNEAILIVHSTIPDLNFESNKAIIGVDNPDPGEYRLHLEPGTHIITFKAEGYLPKKERFFIPARTHQEIRINIMRPEWLQRYMEGQGIENAVNCYYGIGESKKSQSDADARARKEFALSVEVRVKSVLEDEIQQKGRKLKEFTKYISKQISDLSLRGITITERWYEDLERTVLKVPIKETRYFSLIKIEKDKYERLVSDEIDRDLKIKEKEYEEEIALKRLNERKHREELQLKESEHEREKRKDRLKLEKKEHESEIKKDNFLQKLGNIKRRTAELYQQKGLFRDFLNETPPSKVITLRNGEIINGKHEISAGMGISPVTFESIFYGYRFGILEISGEFNLLNNKFDRQDLFLKIQLLPNTGELWKTSLSFGFVEYLNSIYKTNFNKLKPKYSPFLAMNVTVPTFYYSYFSFYGDARKIQVGINNYSLYKHFTDKIGFLLQIDYVYDKSFRNRFNDPMLFQAGVRFKATKNLAFTLAYEKHEILTFTLNGIFSRR